MSILAVSNSAVPSITGSRPNLGDRHRLPFLKLRLRPIGIDSRGARGLGDRARLTRPDHRENLLGAGAANGMTTATSASLSSWMMPFQFHAVDIIGPQGHGSPIRR
ncbi:hypothetical protein [Gordonia sp. Z-3]|uniref:hypothetical protein n=1 Tax=Gordonia sp. Z-3 TaxID=3115408 RepID=UPI002E2BFF60|nr:hypothetical protein [Gordonia sp. Z-3]